MATITTSCSQLSEQILKGLCVSQAGARLHRAQTCFLEQMFRIKQGRIVQTGTKPRLPRESFELDTVAQGGGREGREEVRKRDKRENLLQQTGSIISRTIMFTLRRIIYVSCMELLSLGYR